MKILVVGEDGELALSSSDKLVGPAGCDGADGPRGFTGDAGRDGRNGKDGCRGPKGDRGLPGERGFKGADGRDGISMVGPIGLQGPQGEPGRDGKDGKDASFPDGSDGQVWTYTKSGAHWQYPAPGGFSRMWKNSVDARLNSAASVDLTAYARSLDVASFYALKTSIPSVAGFANSVDVSSSNAAINGLRVSTSTFGLAKVDGTTIAATAGLLSAISQAVLCFQVRLTSDQTVTGATPTLCKPDTFVTNTLGTQYSTSTGKFTPTKAGKYIVFCTSQGLVTSPDTITQASGSVFKNGGSGVGSQICVGQTGPALAAPRFSFVSLAFGVVDMNGTTDTLEMSARIDSSGASGPIVVLGSGNVTFGAIYLGP